MPLPLANAAPAFAVPLVAVGVERPESPPRPANPSGPKILGEDEPVELVVTVGDRERERLGSRLVLVVRLCVGVRVTLGGTSLDDIDALAD